MRWLWITLGALWAAAAIWKLALPRKKRITGNFYTAKPGDPSHFAEAVSFGDDIPEGFKKLGDATEDGAITVDIFQFKGIEGFEHEIRKQLKTGGRNMRVVLQDPRGFWILEQEAPQWERDENGELVVHRISLEEEDDAGQ